MRGSFAPSMQSRMMAAGMAGLSGLGYSGGLYPSNSPTNPTRMPPNQYDLQLRNEVDLFQSIADAGGLQKVCCPSRYNYDKPPYLVMPPEGRPYQQIQALALPTNDGTDTSVVSFLVPVGYDGVINSICNFWTGTGLVEGSGDIIWRLKVGRSWARNLGVIDTTLGSLTSPCPLFRGGIRIYSQQTITYYVNVPVASGLTGGNIVCAVFGWFYPI